MAIRKEYLIEVREKEEHLYYAECFNAEEEAYNYIENNPLDEINKHYDIFCVEYITDKEKCAEIENAGYYIS